MDHKTESPETIYPGSSLNWKSKLIRGQITVELPFWIMSPNDEYLIKINDTEIKCWLNLDFQEVQDGPIFTDSKNKILSINQITWQPSQNQLEAIQGSNAPITRAMKSIVIFETNILSDVLVALNDKKRFKDGIYYLKTLCYSHIPFLNKLINTYRRVTGDPFTYTVSESDVPIWHMEISGSLPYPIHLIKYKSLDRPLHRTDQGKTEKAYYTNSEEMKSELESIPIPGEMYLLDAWGKYYRGHYSDSILSVITAIEVSLESALVKEYKKIQHNDETIESFLNETKTKFKDRLDEYISITGKRIPGPIISWIWYLNGTRYEEELYKTRKLRHKIVHEGYKIDYKSRGIMNESLETSSWFLEWLNDSHFSSPSKIKNYTHSSSLYSNFFFSFEYTPEGILIQPFELPESITSDDLLLNQLFESISQSKADLELSTVMCLEYLDYDLINTNVCDHNTSKNQERFWIIEGDKRTPIFLLNLNNMLKPSDLSDILVRIIHNSTVDPKICINLLVVNQHGSIPLERRNRLFIKNSCNKILKKNNIVIVDIKNLILFAEASQRLYWPIDGIKKQLTKPGEQLTIPTFYELIGEINNYFPSIKVLSIKLYKNKSLKIGNTLSVQYFDKYLEVSINSIQENKNNVTEISGQATIGVNFEHKLKNKAIGLSVYKTEYTKLPKNDVVRYGFRNIEEDNFQIDTKSDNYT